MTERKFAILEAIINDYIQTAEPIGSRTIAKKYGMGISSATIRNEMSDLEDMGYITQLHSSSGRIPSQKGYRFFVDKMMQSRQLTPEEAMFLQRMILDNIYQIEFMMQETAKALARLTSYPAIVSEPYIKKTKIKHIQLVPIDEKSLLLVLITDTKAVKNQVISMTNSPDSDELIKLSNFLNNALKNLTIREINRDIIDKLFVKFGNQAHRLMPILGTIADMVQAEDDMRIFTSGIRNILAFPEFADIRKAETIFKALEERETLLSLLAKESQGDIQIFIGQENDFDFLKECSLIRANYSIDNKNTGTIAIIGPVRMDYVQSVSMLQGVLQNIKHVLEALQES